MYLEIYLTGFVIWFAWCLSKYDEYKHSLDVITFLLACVISAALWPITSLADLFKYLRHRNDTP